MLTRQATCFVAAASIFVMSLATGCSLFSKVEKPRLPYDPEELPWTRQAEDQRMLEREALTREMEETAVGFETLGDYNQALRAWYKAAALSPTWFRPCLEIARLHPLADNDLDAARTAARRAVDLAPGNPRAHLLLGQLLLDAEACPEAMASLRKAVELRGSDVQSRRLLARAALCAGDQGLAAEQFTFLKGLTPDDATLFLELARLYEGQGLTEAAADEYFSLMTRMGRDRIYLLQLLNFYRRNGMTAEADKIQNELQRRYPPEGPKRKLRPLLPSRR